MNTFDQPTLALAALNLSALDFMILAFFFVASFILLVISVYSWLDEKEKEMAKDGDDS